MASETEVPEQQQQQSVLERLLGPRNRDLSVFLPIILGYTNPNSATNPDDETPPQGPGSPNSRGSRDRVILVNPLTQGMMVIEGNEMSLEAFMRDIVGKEGQPPASRSSVEAMPSVEITEESADGECVVCLDEWKIGGKVKEMPCKHRFHGECIEKWLGVHGACPLWRYKMPIDDDHDLSKLSGGDERERREIWVSFTINGERRSADPNLSRPDHEIEG